MHTNAIAAVAGYRFVVVKILNAAGAKNWVSDGFNPEVVIPGKDIRTTFRSQK